jgi:hypothetical protein
VRPTPTPADDIVYPSFIRRINSKGYARNSVTWQLPPQAFVLSEKNGMLSGNAKFRCRIGL